MAAAKWRPQNFTVIIDRNHVQLDGTEAQIMPLGDLRAKLEAFGVNTFCCDGHDVDDLFKTLTAAKEAAPSVIIAETIKGKGVSFMEGQSAWHGKPINDLDFVNAIKELEEGLR